MGIDLAEIPEVHETVEASEEAKLRSPGPGSAKRRKVDSSIKAEFELEVKKLYEWFERIESGLELLTIEEASPQDSFTEEEQVVLVEVGLSIIAPDMITCSTSPWDETLNQGRVAE